MIGLVALLLIEFIEYHLQKIVDFYEWMES